MRSTGCQWASCDAGNSPTSPVLLILCLAMCRAPLWKPPWSVACCRCRGSWLPISTSLWSCSLWVALVGHCPVWRNPPELVLLLCLLGQSQLIAGFLLVELSVAVPFPLKTSWVPSLQMPASQGKELAVHWHAQSLVLP